MKLKTFANILIIFVLVLSQTKSEDPATLCGNGIIDAGEECDNIKKAGCLNCVVESPYKCKNPTGKPSQCYICGNSIFENGE